MQTKFENNILTFFLDGRIDSGNAPEIESEVLSALGENKAEAAVFDAEKLDYISSAGLRILLRVQKTLDKPVEILNVSREVYDIFNVTGFTELMNIQKAFRSVSIEGKQLIGRGMTGSVYRLDEETVIKVFNPNIDFNILIKQENNKARNAFVSGVPTAIPYDIVRVGDSYGTVYELLNAKDLVTVIAGDKEHMDDYIREFAKTVREMHAIKVDPDKFDSIRKNSMNAVSYLASVLTPEETRKVREIYGNIPESDTFVHGDCHIGNVMLQDGNIMFIDLATSGMGHPIYDMISMYSLFRERAENPQAIGESPILRQFTTDEIKRIWNVFVRTYLQTDDEDFIAKAERQIAAFSLTRRLFMVVAMPGVLSPEAFTAMKDAVIAYYDAGLEPICF